MKKKNIRFLKRIRGVSICFILLFSGVDMANATLTDIFTEAITNNSAKVYWTTDIPGNSYVEYGLDSTYGSTSYIDELPRLNHSIILTDLSENTIYHYRVLTIDVYGELDASDDSTFTTLTAAELEAIIRAARTNGDLPKVYYVKTDGDDNNSGMSIDSAWQHPFFAAEQAEPGDTIYLLDGTWYDEHVVFADSGIDVAPITMIAYDDTPTLYCTSPTPVPNIDVGIEIHERSYINVSGITCRRYWKNITVRRSFHSHICGCSVYADGEVIKGICLSENTHYCSIENCFVDGDAWNSTSIGGRYYSGGNWYSEPSTHNTIEGCEVCNNSAHCLVDIMGTSHYIDIVNNTLYHGWSGTIYNHQGRPDHVCIADNLIYTSSSGPYMDAGINDSYFYNNTVYDINDHHLHCRIGNLAYVDTSSNIVALKNTFWGDASYEMAILSGKNHLFDKNDIHSDYGDTEYRLGRGDDHIVRDAIGKTFKVVSAYDAQVVIEFTNSKVFSEDETGEPWYYPDKSKYMLPINENVTITTYSMTTAPSTDSLEVLIIDWDTTGIYYRKWQEICENSSVITSHTVGDFPEYAHVKVDVDGVLYGMYWADSSGWISFDYTAGFAQDTVMFEAYEYTGINEQSSNIITQAISLQVNPNPFSQMTHIKFQAPRTKSQITLRIYNISGQLIKDFSRLTLDAQRPTLFSWDGTDNNGHRVPSGVYFCRLSTTDDSATNKLLLIK